MASIKDLSFHSLFIVPLPDLITYYYKDRGKNK